MPLDKPAESPDLAPQEHQYDRMLHYITQGKPVRFTKSLRVYQMHGWWDDLIARAGHIQRALDRFAGKCEQRRQALKVGRAVLSAPQSPSPGAADGVSVKNQSSLGLGVRANRSIKQEQHHLRVLAQRASILGNLSHEIPYILFNAAQIDFSKKLRTYGLQVPHDIFWDDINARPGIEYTWKLTLGAVIAELRRWKPKRVSFADAVMKALQTPAPLPKPVLAQPLTPLTQSDLFSKL